MFSPHYVHFVCKLSTKPFFQDTEVVVLNLIVVMVVVEAMRIEIVMVEVDVAGKEVI